MLDSACNGHRSHIVRCLRRAVVVCCCANGAARSKERDSESRRSDSGCCRCMIKRNVESGDEECERLEDVRSYGHG